MYKTILVKNLVEEGEVLIKRLESRRIHLTAALWYYFEDLMRWRLVIAAPSVEREGPLRVYGRIEQALAQMPAQELSLSDISVMRPNGYEFRELRSALERSGRVAKKTPKDIAFEDAYIYVWPGGSSRREANKAFYGEF